MEELGLTDRLTQAFASKYLVAVGLAVLTVLLGFANQLL